ncbi:hypothetical protein HMI55_002472, partial [Coelomomyces lativittatus]
MTSSVGGLQSNTYSELKRASYTYQAQHDDELSIQENDLVFILDTNEKEDPDWPLCVIKSKSQPDAIGC